MAAVLTKRDIEQFGRYEFNGCNSSLAARLTNNFIKNNNRFEYLKKVCKEVLNDEFTNYNYYKVKQTVYFLCTDNYNFITNFIFELLKEKCLDIYKDFNSKVNNNNLSLSYINKSYEKYNKLVYNLKNKVLWYYDNSLVKKSTIHDNYSYIFLISKMSYYHYVFQNEYLNSSSNLFSFICLSINNNNYDISELIDFLSIYKTYRKMSYVKHFSGVTYDFKLENNNIFDLLGKSNTFIKKISYRINEKIISLSSDKNLEIPNKIETVIKELELIKFIEDRSIFYIYYYRLLSDRLLNKFINLKLEKRIVSHLNDNSYSYFRKIVLMIEDIKNSIFEKELYTQLTVKATSEKYSNIDISNLNRNIVNAKILKEFAWSDIFSENDSDNDNYILPSVLSAYTDIYNEYFKVRYPDRTFKWIWNYGFAIMETINNGKVFNFKVNMLQCFVLFHLNDNEKITATKLQSLTNIKYKVLGDIFEFISKYKAN